MPLFSFSVRRCLLLAALLLATSTALAQEPSPTSTPEAAPPPSQALARVLLLTGQVQALLDDELAAEVTPAELFDLALDDREAVEVEARRLRALLAASYPEALAAEGGGGAGGAGGEATGGGGEGRRTA